jgi:hypothetical protein
MAAMRIKNAQGDYLRIVIVPRCVPMTFISFYGPGKLRIGRWYISYG